MTARRKAPPPRPPWCGVAGCDPVTRHIEVGPELRPMRCPRCHPMSPGVQAPDEQSSQVRRIDPAVALIDERIAALAKTGRPFTADDVRHGCLACDSSRLGAAFRRAAGHGLIEAVGIDGSHTAGRNASIVRVWVGVAPAEPAPSLFGGEAQ